MFFVYDLLMIGYLGLSRIVYKVMFEFYWFGV